MVTKNLLVELLVEELPPKALKKLGDALAAGIFSGLEQRDFLGAGAAKMAYASPRRLAVHITEVRDISQPRPRPPTTLMPAAVGLDVDGKPTPPLIKRIQTKLYSIYYATICEIDPLINNVSFVIVTILPSSYWKAMHN